MRNRRTTAALGCALVALAGIWLLGSDIRTPTAETPANSAQNESPASDTKAAQGDSSAIPADRSIAPLPPRDAPLAQILGSLQQRADRGDRKAACRLAMELLRCDNVAWWIELEAHIGRADEAEYLKEGNVAAADAAAADTAWRLERMLDCRAVPEELTGRGAHYLQRAFESGYPHAAFYLATARMSDFGFLASLIEDDPEQALAGLYLHARLFGGNGPLRLLGQDTATQQRARELAAQWHRTYFNGRTYRKPLMEAGYFTHSSQSESTAFCSDPANQA